MAVNGKEYSYEDLQISYLGKPVTGIRSVKYGVKREKTKIWALGKDPVARGSGKKEYTCEITLLHSEFLALMTTLPAGSDPTDLKPFDVIVMYVNDENVPVTDIVKGFDVTEAMKELKVDDQFMEITLPGVADKINFSVSNT